MYWMLPSEALLYPGIYLLLHQILFSFYGYDDAHF